jgi:acetyltransferase-like isoleucine patch superfamily enzyme
MQSILLAISNIIFDFMPLTRWYKIRAGMLRFSGVKCPLTLRLVSSARIVYKNVTIGENTFIGHQVLISGNEAYSVTIGGNVDLAPRVCILSGSHEIDMIGKHSAGPGSGGDVIIEDGVWVGANSTILPGVRIGEKSVIGAGSVVTKDIPPYCIAVGNPCKPIKFWNAELGTFESIV